MGPNGKILPENPDVYVKQTVMLEKVSASITKASRFAGRRNRFVPSSECMRVLPHFPCI
jgi:hypothetical protein